MAFQNFAMRRRTGSSPLYGVFASLLDRLERTLTMPHFCNPPTGHAPVSLIPDTDGGPASAAHARATYICPECGLGWQPSRSTRFSSKPRPTHATTFETS
ncbi:MAG: hypothetical protein ABL901_09535 [Hyphomicrobiaceae bacterium]